MLEELPTTPLVVWLATPADIETINALDRFSVSPARDIHRDMQKYFGSVDPSTHERTLIFLAQVGGACAAKAELMIPPQTGASLSASASGYDTSQVGYIKRVIVHPEYRKHGLARLLMQHVIDFARSELGLKYLDLHVWDKNIPAIRLYEDLGFESQHREVYYRLPL